MIKIMNKKKGWIKKISKERQIKKIILTLMKKTIMKIKMNQVLKKRENIETLNNQKG